MGFQIINNNPQNRVKDCYASAPTINLTLRSNGEEGVQVMDCLGNLVQAGLPAPTVAPTVTDSGVTGTWPATQQWGYVYVYVAKTAYPFVENAVTGGGSPAPRSLPSPPTMTNSVTNTHEKLIQFPPSEQANISAIWLYRTDLFADAGEALTNAKAGNLFFIAEIQNNPNFLLLSFLDDAAIIATPEQVESDNFVAPQFQNCFFADPYFWGFGNNQFSVLVNITVSGLVTIADGVSKWFAGRNGQVINFVGVTNGGSDGHGNYYFKFIDNLNAQLYTNLGLSNAGTVSVQGQTMATITGQSTTLYRSKPRNPFSWGSTQLVGGVEVPSQYAFTIGGGLGTAINVVPNLNLLKLDTEGPNKCFTLNLKYAGTSNFEPSLREIATNSVSTQFVQFSATNKQGLSVLWGLDTKQFAILECDGSNQSIISDNVTVTLHALALGDSDRVHFTGVYSSRLEMNCFFIRTEGVENSINVLVYYHWPTDQWGTIRIFDALCATQILDPETNEYKLIIGNSVGFIGELFNPDTFINWYNSPTAGGSNIGFGLPNSHSAPAGIIVDLSVTPLVSGIGCEGNWMTVISYRVFPSAALNNRPVKYFARIASLSTSGPNQLILIDQVLNSQLQDLGPIGPGFQFQGAVSTNFYYLGINEIEIGKFFTLTNPFEHKNFEQVLTTWNGIPDQGANTIYPTVQLGADYQFSAYLLDPVGSPGQPATYTFLSEIALQRIQPSSPDTQSTNVMGLQYADIYATIKFSRVIGIMLRDRNTAPSQLMNFELRFDDAEVISYPRDYLKGLQPLQNYATQPPANQ